jgi:hypothetical protein
LAPAIKQAVVKQCPISKFEAHEDPYAEGRILEELSRIKSRRIIGQFGPMRRDFVGNSEVVRIFLEYCPGGSLDKWMESPSRATSMSNAPFYEVDVWAMFPCLVLGVAAMDRSTEDPDRPALAGVSEITHYEYVAPSFPVLYLLLI